MRFGLDVSQHQLTWPEILERTRYAEQAGFDGAWVFDHFTALYGDPKGPCLEAWTLLAALAASTERIRLGALVTGATYRHPSLLATEAVTVDHVSGGRLELGLGAAWHEPEHRRLGFPFPPPGERVTLVQETVRVIKALTSEDGGDVRGRFATLEDGWYRPLPVQRPHPPIWIGAGGERMLRFVGREADAWHSFGGPRQLAQRWKIVERAAEEAGRDPGAILRSSALSLSQPMEDVRREIDAWTEVGFGYLTVGWPSEGKARLDEFVERVLPDYTG